MLMLSRRIGESIQIGDDVIVTVTEIDGNQVKLGIDAPRAVDVWRTELLARVLDEAAAKKAAGGL